MLHSIQYPPLESLKHLEGKGNFAVSKYYKWPFKPFYRHKFKMIIDMMKDEHYNRVLDFGAGSAIFRPELLSHSNFVTCVDKSSPINPLWKFDAIVCASVLEFCHLPFTVDMLSKIMVLKGALYIASPMDTNLSRWYFKLIKDTNHRHSHKLIKQSIKKHFFIEDYKEWHGLYFSMKARR